MRDDDERATRRAARCRRASRCPRRRGGWPAGRAGAGRGRRGRTRRARHGASAAGQPAHVASSACPPSAVRDAALRADRPAQACCGPVPAEDDVAHPCPAEVVPLRQAAPSRSPPAGATRPRRAARGPARTSSSVDLPPPLSPTTPISVARRNPERQAVQQDPRRVAGDVRGDRLQVDEVRHRARTGGQLGAGHRGFDDPRPRHRAVRHPHGAAHAHARQLGGDVERGVRPRAQERARRPGAGDEPGEGTRVDARPQCAAQLGGEADGRGLQVVAEGQGEPAGVATSEASSTARRPPGGQDAPRGAGRARRRRRAWQAGAVSAITQCRVCREHRHDPLAPDRAERGAAGQRERDVAPSPAARADSSSRDRSSFHSADRPTSAAAASALPPAMPPATGCPCAGRGHIGDPVGPLGEQLDRAPARLVSSAGSVRDAFAVTVIRGPGVDRDETSSNRLTAWNTVTRRGSRRRGGRGASLRGLVAALCLARPRHLVLRKPDVEPARN